ncbi:MAG: CRISPR-associated helicase Cas3' [Marinobacterium sp.]
MSRRVEHQCYAPCFRYWGKAQSMDEASARYHLLVWHSLDVAACGWELLSDDYPWCQELAQALAIEPKQLRRILTFFIALHDLGKFFRAFQNLAPDLSDALVPPVAGLSYAQVRHDSLGYWLWQSPGFRQAFVDLLGSEQKRLRLGYLDPLFKVVTGHHGQPPKEQPGMLQNYCLTDDVEAATAFMQQVADLLLMPEDRVLLQLKEQWKPLKSVSWQLAGLVVLADWSGSNRNRFPYVESPMPLGRYWNDHALPQAATAIGELPLKAPSPSAFQNATELFSFLETPTPLQAFAVGQPLVESPQLFILEDVTGAGKTEAAMLLVHRMLSQGLAEGVYVGLPTMATANAMYGRLGECYRRLYTPDAKPSLVLSHGARHLSGAFSQSVAAGFTDRTELSAQASDRVYAKDELSASVYCNAWVADSRKKALFADVGVGTIDQALLAVLPARHQSLRMLGLHRKIIVIDEVHAYDPYMQKLLQALLEMHARQGGSAILLSATLPQAMKKKLVDSYAAGLGHQAPALVEQNYPLVTHFPTSEGAHEFPVATRATVARQVRVVPLGDEAAVWQVIEQAVAEGKAVCWIRNTVDTAREAYAHAERLPSIDAERLHLFHSRFAMVDRQRVEAEVLGWFGKVSTPEKRRGRLLISTQVVEQSLDLDFDLMVTDLAPVDLIIQRAGRLHRHQRGERGSPILYLHTPDPFAEVDEHWLAPQRGTEAVYRDPGMLWRSAAVVLQNEGFRMPDDARHLIESVYHPDTELDTPEPLFQASLRAEGEQRASSSMAGFNQLDLTQGYSAESNQQGWAEDVNVPTRLSDETCSVVLVVPDDKGGWRPYAQIEKHGWDLSALSLRAKLWHQAEQQIPQNIAEQLEAFRETQPALKWHKLFPLVGELTSYYSSSMGWRVPVGTGNVVHS